MSGVSAERNNGPNVLLVDDREQNLVALEAILEPLGQNLVLARSGDEALRALLYDDFAVILLDVQMPGLDGFETAELIKERERTRHIPIIFLTAISKDEQHVFRGYSAGAVDYLFKPFVPEVLRSKVAVFIELWEKTEQLREQEERLRHQEIAELERTSEARYRTLAEAMPQLIWRADPEGRATYYNERWFAYTGLDPAEATGSDWEQIVHPDDLPATLARWELAAATGGEFEMEYRLRRVDDTYRWHLGRAVPVRGPDGEIESWVGTATDIDDKRRAEEAQRFLIEAGEVLGSSLDYRRTLAAVAEAAVPRIADWCAVHVVEQNGSLGELAIAHVDPIKLKLVLELQERYPSDPRAPTGPHQVVRTGKPELVSEIPEGLLEASAQDELHLELLRGLGLRSYMCVPLAVRDRVVGAITFAQAESGRTYDEVDLALAEDLARRAATAVDNARLFRQAEERGRAARVLDTVGDGVFLVDREGVVRLWNAAAESVTGIGRRDVLGRRADGVIPGWDQLQPRIPVASAPRAGRPETVPLEVGGRELWLSIAGVGFDEGTVYAFRDLTEERVLEAMKSDFVATVSHELRTPLAAIHGAALTLLRVDLEVDDELRGRLLQIVGDESSRLAEIVNDLLLASHLDSGRLQLRIESCDARELAGAVLEAARTHVPDGITLDLEAASELPPVAADRGQLHQVLANLLDNAIKYSPDGGPVQMALEPRGSRMRFSVSDRGLGIPRAEHQRVFEKFYRLDPNMTRGIGGTGLGLYICRELVRMMHGRVWVDSRDAEGSTFHVEIPLAEARRRRSTGEPQAAASGA
jgi:PAS domain S-box-containing protein